MPDVFEKCHRAMFKIRGIDDEDRPAVDRVLFREAPLENAGPWIQIDGHRILQFGTNDYLGLCRHPRIRRAAASIARRHGIGLPMGSRALTGNIALHRQLEQAVAEFKKTEEAVVFVTGADAMMGSVAALASVRDWVVLDAHAHTSLICGARMAGAPLRFFRHNDPEHLDTVLREIPSRNGKLVVVDGVYSMQGDLAVLPEISDVCRRHGARLIVDDAHGTGVFGHDGRGVAEHFGVEDRVDLHLGTFSKAIGTCGGFAAGSHVVIDYVRHHAPTMLFTKAMPACLAAATIESIRLLSRSRRRRRALWTNRQALQEGLRREGFDLGSTASPITPINCAGNSAAHLANRLYDEYRIWVSAAFYPAVPAGTSIVRLIATALHGDDSIQCFLSAMREICRQFPQYGRRDGLGHVLSGDR